MGGLCDNIVSCGFSLKIIKKITTYIADRDHNVNIGWRLVAYFM